MNVLIIGSGAREHSLAWKITQSPILNNLYCSPGSDAIATYAQCVALDSDKAIIDFCQQNKIDLVVVGPEQPLVDGLADRLTEANIPVFGPSSAGAMLEGSKLFAKEFMRKFGIASANYTTYTNLKEALDALTKRKTWPLVIKADGLAAGKGVSVCRSYDEGDVEQVTNTIFEKYSAEGQPVIFEDFLDGDEVSIFVITDGDGYVILPSAQDHKAVFDLERGPNTGGMGAYAPTPLITPKLLSTIEDEVIKPTLSGLKSEGIKYCGVLYIGLIISDQKPYVLEYNCRFGDPEAQVLMLLIKNDLLPILAATANNQLEQQLKTESLKIYPGYAACVVKAAENYPATPRLGDWIDGLAQPLSMYEQIFHAGTKHVQQGWQTSGGRVLSLCAYAKNLADVLERTLNMADAIQWPGSHHRRDIGLKASRYMLPQQPLVGIVMGSKSDIEIGRKAVATLASLGIKSELAVASAHRTPQRVREFISSARNAGVEVFIAIAGMSAALPGVVAAETHAPVIGVPVNSSFDGLDASLSVIQMPPGVPVAGVGVNAAVNAALLATRILALHYPTFSLALREYSLRATIDIAEQHKKLNLSTLI